MSKQWYRVVFLFVDGSGFLAFFFSFQAPWLKQFN